MKDLESVTRDRNINELSCTTLSAVSIKMRTDIGSREVNDSIARLKCVYVWRPSNSQTYHIRDIGSQILSLLLLVLVAMGSIKIVISDIYI